MSSIEFLEKQYNENGKLSSLDFYQAKEMYKQEFSTFHNELKISGDETQVSKSDIGYNNISNPYTKRWIESAKWYKEQLKKYIKD